MRSFKRLRIFAKFIAEMILKNPENERFQSINIIFQQIIKKVIKKSIKDFRNDNTISSKY